MSTIVRLTTGINKVNVANPKDNLEEIQLLIKDLPHQGSDIIVLPRWAFLSPECGSLLQNGVMVKNCQKALDELAKNTKHLPSYLIVGTITDTWGIATPALAVLYRGEVKAVLLCDDSAAGSFDEKNIFACGSLRFGILTGSFDTLTEQATVAAKYGCDLLVLPSYEPAMAGSIDTALQTVEQLSRSFGCGIAIVNGGIGGSSSPYLYRGFSCIYECGQKLASMKGENESFSLTADFDSEIIQSSKRYHKNTSPVMQVPIVFPKPDLLRPIVKNPFLPEVGKDKYLEELFQYQARSLATRMANTGFNKLVLGVSGGLDSTSALLVSVAACDYLELPRTNIIGITQPGMGTSDRTYFNALSIMEALGITSHDISIRPGAQQMLSDISHGGDLDTTYENVQARERSQMLFNLANMHGAIVVGSGDLSEEALGFSTFGGDHLSNYNVNACLPKTVLREMMYHLANIALFPEATDNIRETLDTPVSPELLPPDAMGQIQQKTEDILGPYELHDFFLYYFVRYSMRPSKIYNYARIAFSGTMSGEFIKEKLSFFIRKFCSAHFKRTCAPDAASITEVNLLGVRYTMPSDLDPSSLLADLN